jgi:hypothetical protein
MLVSGLWTRGFRVFRGEGLEPLNSSPQEIEQKNSALEITKGIAGLRLRWPGSHRKICFSEQLRESIRETQGISVFR